MDLLRREEQVETPGERGEDTREDRETGETEHRDPWW